MESAASECKGRRIVVPDGSGRGSLVWGPDYLADFANRLLDNLDRPSLSDLQAYVQDLSVGWGSACSGTDSPSWCFSALQFEFQQRGWGTSFEHIISAEKNPNKIEFIAAEAKPAQLFSCIFDITRSMAYNRMTQQQETPDPHDEIRGWLIGFSCQTVSRLNADKGTASLAIEDCVGTTGITFQGVCLILDRKRPKFCILENVPGLQTNSQDKLVAGIVRAKGYVVKIVLMSPLEFGFPQSRNRLWFFVSSCGCRPRIALQRGRYLLDV